VLAEVATDGVHLVDDTRVSGLHQGATVDRGSRLMAGAFLVPRASFFQQFLGSWGAVHA